MNWGKLAANTERPLLWGVYCCLALLLLTPMVVTTNTYFPFVVGKALYARTLIEVLLCLWTALMLLRPCYRPPRSTLLLLLAAGLAASALATIGSVGPLRSVWSNFERMQGLVDAAHWFALALVAASVLRERGQVRALLNANLGVALAIGGLAVVGYLMMRVPFYGLTERDAPRIGSFFGNATYLGAYATTNLLLAAGFLARSFVGAKAKGGSTPGGSKRAPANTSPERLAPLLRGPGARWLARGFWAATALLCLFALFVSGSFTALAALAVGLGVLVVAAIGFVRSRLVRRLALGAAVLAALGATGVAVVFAFPAAFPAIAEATLEEPLLQRIANANINNPSFRKRRLAWSAGIDGFMEKPWLGWGPENFMVVFGRYATGFGVKTEVHDYAHNKLIEEAATKGIVGLVCHVALWLFVFHAIWRATRSGTPPDRVFAVFAGAALVAFFVQQQALVDALPTSLQLVLLLVFVASEERAARREGRPVWRWPEIATPSRWWGERSGPAARPLARRLAIAAWACALVAVAAAGMATNQAIYAAATNIAGYGAVRPAPERPLADIEQALLDFEPLANATRKRLFHMVKTKWATLRVRRSAEARRLLARIEQEGALAMAEEPENWLLHAALAKAYCVAGRTEPGYTAKSARERAKALALAPKMDSFLSWDLVTHERCRGGPAPGSTE